MTDAAGLGIPDLEDERQIGRGGFSVVYAATDTRFDRLVAVKVLNPLTDDRDRRRFETECRVMGRVSGHPNVVTVHHAAFLADDRPYLIMELVEGGSLADRLRHGPMPWPEACRVMAEISGALDHAHQGQVLHRDIKPANILLDADAGVPKLTDFGIASLGGGTVSQTSTEISATWLHTAPETFNNQRDARSDVYSMASTLYHLIAGQAPHYRDTDTQIEPLLARLMMEPAPPLPPQIVPAPIGDFIARNLSKNPDQRSQSAASFGQELDALTTAASSPDQATRGIYAPPPEATPAAPTSARSVPPPAPIAAPAADQVVPPPVGGGPSPSVPDPVQTSGPGPTPTAATKKTNLVGVALLGVALLFLVGLAGIGVLLASRNSDGDGSGNREEATDSTDVDGGSTDGSVEGEVDGQATDSDAGDFGSGGGGGDTDDGGDGSTGDDQPVGGDDSTDEAPPVDDSACPVGGLTPAVRPPGAETVIDSIGCIRYEAVLLAVGQSHDYILRLDTGRQVSLFLDTGCSGVSYSITGPRNDEIAAESGACLDSSHLITAATDGDYRVRIESADDQSAYSLGLIEVTTPSRQVDGAPIESNCPSPVAIPVRQPATLTLSFDENDCPAQGADLAILGQRDRFELALVAGDRISIGLDTGCSGTAIEVTGPQGTIIEPTGSCLDFSDLLEVETAGTYFVDIIATDTFATYKLTLLDVTA